MISKKQFCFLFIYFQVVLVLFIYLYGFFPVEHNSVKKSNSFSGDELPSGRRTIDKMALIVIDALRYDFVKSEDNFMPYLSSSILKQESCFTAVKAHSPTVTLPRLKAITSGMLSSYIDVLLNFFSSNFEEDNFINSAKLNGLKLVFYGDETWLKLFPASFMRSEGTNSFFTLDYTEVDDNVTRHLDSEFEKNDWDFIILHYLGLDHIGHTEGPSSPFVKPKLQEMDGIIKKFSQHFQKMEEKEGLKTMIIVTGDHGMKDSGSHGGVTYPEVTVPLISVGTPCRALAGWPKDLVPLQIDIAPTISALLGLPIPKHNMGKLMHSYLYKMQYQDILKYLLFNSEQLGKLQDGYDDDVSLQELQKKTNLFLKTNLSEKKSERLTQKFFFYLNDLSLDIVESNTNFKFLYLVSGALGLIVYLIVFIFILAEKYPKPKTTIQWFLILGTVFHAVSFLSSSFIEEEHQTWYFLWITLCVLLVFKQSHKKIFDWDDVRWPWIAIGISHRFLRKLNQTGDKWASLPDIRFFFTTVGGQSYLFPFFILGIGLVFLCAFFEKCSHRQLVAYSVSLLAVTFFRITTGSFPSNFLDIFPKSRGLFEIVLFWVSTSIFTIQAIRNKVPKYLIWLLIASLLLRPHNVILLPLQVFISKQIYRTFHKTQDSLWNNVAHIWMGNVFYFYQGNGNSLANIDVAAGFVGVQTYIPLYAALMTAAHTSNGHILAYILSPESILVHGAVRILPLAVYCTALFFQLHHLFIWSVFSPKLLYESYFSVVLLLLMLRTNLYK